MIACTRCGRWHSDAEEDLGRRLSCTEVKRYWARIRSEHMRIYGHRAQITTDDSGRWICLKCGRKLQDKELRERKWQDWGSHWT